MNARDVRRLKTLESYVNFSTDLIPGSFTSRISNLTMDLTAFQISYIVVESIIALFSIIGNGFILFVFAREERLRRNKRNFYLMSLSLCDFLLAALGIPATVLVKI